MLELADDLKLPIDIVTQTMAIVAKRRVGKSYTMRRFVEQLHGSGQQVVLVDPKGDQWGIRSAADGRGPGLPFVILGGERADVPLETSAGELVAKLVVEERVSAVLDLSLFRKREVAVFMADFLEALYRLKAKEVYRTPMMLVVDESDAIAPQKPQPGEERMLGAIEDIVRRGGQRGIGCVCITQRTAVLNKNVLTQAQILVALRTIAPQDLKAMKEWIDVHGEEAQRKTLMDSLPSLPVGDAWFWSPGWPSEEGIFRRVHVLPIQTFDSGATPKPGEKRQEPKSLADVDIEALKRQMSATIEKAKADDPRELRKQLAELRKQLDRAGQIVPGGTNSTPNSQLPTPKVVEKPIITDAQLDRLDKLTSRVEAIQERQAESVGKALAGLRAELTAIHGSIKAIVQPRLPLPSTPQRRYAVVGEARTQSLTVRPAPAPPASSNGHLTGPETKIRTSLAELEALGLHPADKQQVGLMAGYTNVRSGGFSEPLGRLITSGYATSPQTGKIAITDQGRATVGQVDPPATPDEMQARIMAKLTGPEQKLLRVIVQHYPKAITKEELGAACGYTNIRSGGFSEPLGRLNTLGIIRTPNRGEVVASPALFLEA